MISSDFDYSIFFIFLPVSNYGLLIETIKFLTGLDPLFT